MVPSDTEAGKCVASLGRKLHQKLRVKHGLGAEFKMPHRPLGFTYPAPPTLSQIPQVKRKLVPAQLTKRIQRRDAGSGVDLPWGEGGWACKLKEFLWRLYMYSCSWMKSKPRSAGSGSLTVGSATRGSPKTQRQVRDWRESAEVVSNHPVVFHGLRDLGVSSELLS